MPPDSAEVPSDASCYEPPLGSEAELRLLGDLKGKRVLELGCGTARNSVAFARQGAIAIGVEPSAELLAAARRLCEREEVRVELRQGDLADLAFVRADSVDAVFSAGALGYVEDLGRVFRQVHRVLRVGAPLVFSVPHPAYHLIDGADHEQPLLVRRSYFDREPLPEDGPAGARTRYHHTLSDLHTALARASYRVDTLLEPQPPPTGPRGADWQEAARYVPRVLVVRARKEGS